MSYEIFDRTSHQTTTRKVIRSHSSPAISIYKTGQISLSRTATRQLDQVDAKSVLLMWDKETSTMVIRPIGLKDPRAHKITYNKEKNQSRFSAKQFLNWIGYNHKKTHSKAKWVEEHGWFEVQISLQ